MPRQPKPFPHQGWYYTTTGGKWVKLCPLGEGLERATQLLAELRSGAAPVARGGLTVGAVVKLYLDFARGYYLKTDGTPTDEVWQIEVATRPLPSALPIAQLTREHLKVARDEWVERGLTRFVCNERVQRIKRWARWAAEEGHCPDTVAAALSLLTPLKQNRTKAPELDDVPPAAISAVVATLAHLDEPWNSIVRLQWWTGIRPSGVVGLRVDELHAGPGDALRIDFQKRHKTAFRGKRLTVELGPQAALVVRPWILKAMLSGREHVFRSRWQPREGALSLEGYETAVKTACRRAGVEPWTPNQLRHAHATRVREAMGLEAAGAALGHASLDVTEIYAERDRELQARVARRLG